MLIFRNNRNLAIVALIAIVNALGYGIIIPILYPYSKSFGLTDFQNALLLSTFFLCSFFSAPIIGRLSDKYGRKPLLVTSIAGTATSFLLLAVAPNAIFLFLARALDGITAGNIPVVAAVISDTNESHNRAKGFGIIGASFGFGFFFGPAISALTVGFGTHIPFLIAALISIFATIITILFLPETNKNIGQVRKGKLFDFKRLAGALVHPAVGKTLFVSFLYNIAFGALLFAYQPFAIKILHFTPAQIGLVFTMIGAIGIFVQTFLLQRVIKKFGEKKTFTYAVFIASWAFVSYFFVRSVPIYIVTVIVFGFSNSFVGPLIQTLLSRETDEKSQGTIQGLNSSYVSIGNILGPIIAGALATFYIPLPFLLCALVGFSCFFLSFRIRKAPKEHAFG
ncbi:MAG: hypothetical protein AUK12_02685 [Candidatus Levybacteria bacterium CG2_30_37_29]|nr:MAG: hypothetical protein AUK12_02685 [Candidatus Levybacteria bacterium CG2_30_37_29]